MQVPGIGRKWATFGCVECEYVFAWRIPQWCEDLPRCQDCDGATQILSILFSREERLRGVDDGGLPQPEAA